MQNAGDILAFIPKRRLTFAGVLRYSSFPAMLVLGLKSTLLRSEVIAGSKCPQCNSGLPIKIEISGYYFQIYWIPLFPFQKGFCARCQSCEWKQFDKQMPSDLLARSKQLTAEAKYPIWYYVGWLVLGLLLWFSVWAINDGNKNDLICICL